MTVFGVVTANGLNDSSFLNKICSFSLTAALKYDKVMAQISYKQQAGQFNTTHRTHMDEMKQLKMTVFGVLTANSLTVSLFLNKIGPTFCKQQR